ncbi:MAG: hypothetical protein NTW56_01490 [Alphaproteobacteria bacterium]|jgi:hypothetical protein|nr:hypothetical protein [Alphaproteobacteria bacterium]
MTQAVTFHLLCSAEPGMLTRCLAPFAKRDLVPDIMNARREGDVLRVTLGMQAIPEGEVHLVEGNLRQIIGVLELSRRESLRAAA